MTEEIDLEDGGELPRFNVRLPKKLTEKYVVKPSEKGKKLIMLNNSRGAKVDIRWNVTKVEQTPMPQVDRFDVEKVRWYHSERDKVPCFPHLTKFLNGWNTEARSWFRRQRNKTKTWALHNVQNHVPSFEDEQRTKSTGGHHVQGVGKGILT